MYRKDSNMNPALVKPIKSFEKDHVTGCAEACWDTCSCVSFSVSAGSPHLCSLYDTLDENKLTLEVGFTFYTMMN